MPGQWFASIAVTQTVAEVAAFCKADPDLSFDNLMGSAGGVIAQPALGRVSDVYGYGAAYVVSGAIQALALPFVLLARREHAVSDPIARDDDVDVPGATAAGPAPADGDLRP